MTDLGDGILESYIQSMPKKNHLLQLLLRLPRAGILSQVPVYKTVLRELMELRPAGLVRCTRMQVVTAVERLI